MQLFFICVNIKGLLLRCQLRKLATASNQNSINKTCTQKTICLLVNVSHKTKIIFDRFQHDLDTCYLVFASGVFPAEQISCCLERHCGISWMDFLVGV